MTSKDLLSVNEQIKTIAIKNKVKEGNTYKYVDTPYATVHARVLAFRTLFPNGIIETEMTYDEKFVYAEAKVSSEEHLLSVGHAKEIKNGNFSTEVAESSAVGRALGFLGIGIQNGIATAEDMQKKNEKEVFDVPIPNNKDELCEKFKALYSIEEQVKILNMKQIVRVEDMTYESLQKYVEDRQKK